MTTDDKIKDEKLQHDVKREAEKISASFSGKINKYDKCLKREEILPTDQSRIIEKARFPYSSLGKAFEKQIQTIKDKGKKQVQALEVSEPITQKLAIQDAIPGKHIEGRS